MSPGQTGLAYQGNVPGAVRGDWFDCNISSADPQYRALDVRGAVTGDDGTFQIWAQNSGTSPTAATGNTTNLRWRVERYL